MPAPIIRKTKIVCTIGPASQETDTLEKFLVNGMNVARLNFSHGTYEEHRSRIASIRQASKNTGIPVAIMLDTKGPEIRVGFFKNGRIKLSEGNEFVLTTRQITGTEKEASVNYEKLPEDVKVGNQVLLDDGLISLRVKKVEGTEIICEVENGGELSDRKKVNIPGVNVNLPGLTEKDIDDIRLGIEEDVDIIAASFIRNAEDVINIRRVLERYDSEINIISKIENRQGVENLDEIIRVSDGIMVARGDLGVEIPAEEVPIVQKKLISRCNTAGKPVITATQMLESMIRNPRPTRAEASDVANAIYDGTDAIMLSAETATGKYPVEAVQTMSRIAVRIEESLDWEEFSKKRASTVAKSTTEAISYATCASAHSLGAAAIITATKSGSTARMVSKYSPKVPIVAVTPNQKTRQQLLLVKGVYPLISPESETTDGMITIAVDTAVQAGYVKNGELVVITAGVPVGIPGSTNLIKIHTVGEVIARGMGIGKKPVAGKVVIAKKPAEAIEKVGKGDILVTVSADSDFLPALKKAAALITEEGGLTSNGAIMGINLGIEVIVGVKNATAKLEQSELVTVDPLRGLIYRGNAKVL